MNGSLPHTHTHTPIRWSFGVIMQIATLMQNRLCVHLQHNIWINLCYFQQIAKGGGVQNPLRPKYCWSINSLKYENPWLLLCIFCYPVPRYIFFPLSSSFFDWWFFVGSGWDSNVYFIFFSMCKSNKLNKHTVFPVFSKLSCSFFLCYCLLFKMWEHSEKPALIALIQALKHL